MKKIDLQKLVREALLASLTEAETATAPAPKKPSASLKTPKAEEPVAPVSSDKSPSDQAHEMGLYYLHWGNWGKIGDPSGRAVAKTIGNKLVRTDAGAEQPPQATPAAPEPVASAPTAEKPKGYQVVKSSTPPGVPGSITPPKDPEGNPIEVVVGGEKGYIDQINNETHCIDITLHSGLFVSVPKSQIKATVKKVKPTKSTSEMNADKLGIPPEVEKECNHIFKEAGRKPYDPHGETGIRPGWNKGLDTNDIPFDAHAKETVLALLEKIGDPVKLVLWLKKKFQEETVNGKQRILQYLGIVKELGLLDGNAVEGVPQV